MTRKSITEQATSNRDRLSAMGAVAAELKTWRPQAEVLREVEAVPTIFPSFDLATGVGGYPTSRLCVVHAPSNEGKSTFALGLGRSFLQRDHFFGFGDAERTTPQTYVKTMMGPMIDHPGFSALPIGTYEQVRSSVREYCEAISKARAADRIPRETTGLIVIDSLRKLVPEKLWAELSKAIKADAEDKPAAKQSRFEKNKKPKGVDGAGGRAGQIKAAMNSAWVDELIPLLADHRIAMLIIARETVEEGEGFMDDEIVKVGGGVAINYDASLRLRCLRRFVHEDLGGKAKELVGERIEIQVMKTKIHSKDQRIPKAFFHVSNGRLCPEGFDLARDCLELGKDLGVIELAGAWYKFEGKNIAQGAPATLKRMHDDAGLTAAIERACRAAA